MAFEMLVFWHFKWGGDTKSEVVQRRMVRPYVHIYIRWQHVVRVTFYTHFSIVLDVYYSKFVTH